MNNMINYKYLCCYRSTHQRGVSFNTKESIIRFVFHNHQILYIYIYENTTSNWLIESTLDYYVKTTFLCNNYVFVTLCVCWDSELLPLESRRCQDTNFLVSGTTKVCVMVIYSSTGDDKIGNLTTFCFWCQFLSETCLVDLSIRSIFRWKIIPALQRE